MICFSGGVKSNQRQGNMTNNRAAGAGNNRTGNMGNQRQGNVGNQRQGNMGNQNRMSGGPAGRGPVGGNAQRNMRGPMNNGGNAGQMNQMNRFSGNKFGGKIANKNYFSEDILFPLLSQFSNI